MKKCTWKMIRCTNKGTLIQMLFHLGQDFRLHKYPTLVEMINNGEITAYVDNIMISIGTNNIWKLKYFINALRDNGLRTNLAK